MALEYPISKEISNIITRMLQYVCLAGGRMAGLQEFFFFFFAFLLPHSLRHSRLGGQESGQG